MARVVNSAKFSCYATTRDEAVETMDELGMAFLDFIKGNPWLVVDDDYKKMLAMEAQCPVMADDQGFVYTGVRTYLFRGPFRKDVVESMGPGVETQQGAS